MSFLAPGQPEAIQVTVLTPRVIHVTWKPPKYKGNGVFGYEIHYNKSSRGIDETISVTELVLGREIRDLRPYTYYKVQVVATSIPRNGPRSFAKVVRTSEAGESCIIEVAECTIIFEWRTSRTTILRERTLKNCGLLCELQLKAPCTPGASCSKRGQR